MASFDECFANIPSLKDRPKDMTTFWNKQITKLKKIPIEIDAKKKISKKVLKETQVNISYKSATKTCIEGHLYSPKKLVKKPPVVIIFPDYEEPKVEPVNVLSQKGIAQFIVRLRGHDRIYDPPEEVQETEKSGLGLFKENLMKKEAHYTTQLFLDAFRTLEMIRLRKEIDTSRIGLWGRGIGAVMALFVSAFMKRTTSLFLEKPSLANFDVTQNLSRANCCLEINQELKTQTRNKTAIKNNLKYFDAIYFADKIKAPTAMVLNLKDTEAVPQGGFAIFHHIKGEKDMHLFVNDDQQALKDEQKKTLSTAGDFFKKTLF